MKLKHFYVKKLTSQRARVLHRFLGSIDRCHTMVYTDNGQPCTSCLWNLKRRNGTHIVQLDYHGDFCSVAIWRTTSENS